MANQHQKTIDQLNNLLEINNDRTEGYLKFLFWLPL